MKQEIINNTLNVTSHLMHSIGWMGACYATSAIHHILLTEQGVRNDPILGVTKVDESIFDHAWVEIDDLIYDTAISLPQENANFFETFGSDGVRGEIGSKKIYVTDNIEIIYGVLNLDVDDDVIANLENFGKFMTHSPSFNKSIDYWDLTIELGKCLHLSLNRSELISRYSNKEWSLIK